MHKVNRFFSSVVLVAAASLTFANASLTLGSKAPELSIKTWVKGAPVKSFEKGKVYVVEFWATWCGPCRTSIPHITELAKKNKDVTFIGVGIWEDNDDQRVEKFVKEMGDKMDYTVAYSGNKEGMSETWMKAAGRNGIPSSFIVQDQKIVWMGHPMSMDKPLAEIKAGTYDMAKVKAELEAEAEKDRQAAALQKELASCEKMYDAGQKDEAKAKLEKLMKDNPKMARMGDGTLLKWKAMEDPEGFLAGAKKVAKDAAARDAYVMFALSNAAKKDAMADLGLKAMDLIAEETEMKDVLVLYYAGFANDRAGKKEATIKYGEAALAIFDTIEMKGNPDLKKAIQAMVDKAKK